MSTNPSKIIFLEFNEICPPLIQQFIAAGELPNFKQFYQESQVFVTDAEEAQEDLEPWIQWITVHTGLSYEQHGIHDLGHAYKLNAKSIWDSISESGRRVWVCGSMNVAYEDPINGLVLPDPWSNSKIKCEKELESYCNFVRSNVQEHTNESPSLNRMEYLKVLSFLLSHGLSIETTARLIKQMLKEITSQERWKRALILDRLQWDVFKHYYNKTKPDFATFFSNSVAHFQHKYWRNMQPELFTVKPNDSDQARFKDAVLLAYKETDQILGKAIQLAGNDVTLVLTSALSQKPYLEAEESGGKQFYRPKSFDKFLASMPFNNVLEVVPAMSGDFSLNFASEADAENASVKMKKITLNDSAVLKTRREGSAIHSGCRIFHELAADSEIDLGDGEEKLPFFDLFYKADSIKSGMHHPDGVFWIRNKAHKHHVHEEKVPLRAIAPEVLAHFGINLAPEMSKSPIRFDF